MNAKIDGRMLVRDVVVRFPQARTALEAFGVDYCCGGKHPLAEAAREAGIDLAALLAAVNKAIAEPVTRPGQPLVNWVDGNLSALADHILATHHTVMHRELPHAVNLLAKVVHAHGPKHGEMLTRLQGVFEALRVELDAHLLKEEQVLFPYIKEMDAQVAADGTVLPMHCGSIQNPIRQMEREHENAGEALVAMREITGDYTLPTDACPTFAALYELLTRIEGDLHEHIHLENNILFPRAVAMESSAVK